MKVVIAMDSFKGSLSSMEAGRAAAEGVLRCCPGAETVVRPLADGGEGTVETLIDGLGLTPRTITVCGPLGEPTECTYGIWPERQTAVLEMASAAGLPLVPPEQRNPLLTTTFGVGEMIRDAVLAGCRDFIVGIGGSATNDGGAGMLQALGFVLLDSDGNPVRRGAAGLADLAQIKTEHVLPELAACRFRIACDVNNPLCGADGASAVFGPQKGADPEMVRKMDGWLGHFAELAAEVSDAADPLYPGTGAAGGLGFAFQAFTRAALESGAGIILDATGLEEHLKGAELFLTGEGRLDGQSAMGKAPVAAAQLAERCGCTALAFAGGVTEDAGICNEKGITAFFPVVRGVTTREEAMNPEKARANMTAAVEQAVRLWMKAGLMS